MSLSLLPENIESQREPSAHALFGAVLFKEWIKLRLVVGLLALASLAFAIVLSLRVRRLFAINEAEAVWSAWIFKGYLFFDPFWWLPFTMGFAIGVIQFLPEVASGRIRLVLHLPISEDRALGLHLLAGVVAYTACWLPATIVFSLVGLQYFPPEFQHHLASGMWPRILAGWVAYCFTVGILLHPHWLVKALMALLTVGALPIFLKVGWYNSYDRLLPALTAWTLASTIVPLGACRAFRKGR